MNYKLSNDTQANNKLSIKSVNQATIPPRVLIVDDELMNRRLLAATLSTQNYIIMQASSGMETLTIIDEGLKPDIIILDVMMPGMSGLEVTHKLREKWQADELPILLLTAKNQIEDVVSGLESGANDYLTKPVFKDELIAKIKIHIHIKELKAETLRIAKENETKLRKFLEAVPVGVAVLESDGNPCFFNQKAQQLFGKELTSDTPKASVEQLSDIYQVYVAGTDQRYPTEKMPVMRALQGESTSVDDMEIHRDGEVIPIEVWGTSIFDENGNIAYAIAAFQDITERKHSETERARITDELAKLNTAYEKFVPHEFLNQLDKNSVLDVQLGDQIEKEMTLLFSDIRDFTALSENMAPQDNFNFINSYLGQMEPIISKHHGVIDKYMGDAIMALFPNSADDAICGAISMLKILKEYNKDLQNRGYRPIKIGIGLNTGPLMLGIVGGPNHMEGTVISDAVNLASRVEGLTKIYGSALLMTEHTYLKLANPSKYHIRVIDAVKVAGKTEEITVYEIFDAEEPDMIALKDQTLTIFKQGFVLYHCEEFEEAKPFFEQILQVNKNDKAAQAYLSRCNKLVKLEIEPDLPKLKHWRKDRE